MTTAPQILIAGIGNIFLGDDAFGVHVVRLLASHPFPPGIKVVDFGIRGIDLTYALLEPCDLAILIDAAPRGEAPGTLYVIEPDTAGDPPLALIESHSLDPAKVLALVHSMGGHPGRVLVVGCEPTPLDEYEDMQIDLSPAVQAAVQPAAQKVISLVNEFLNNLVLQETAQ